MTSAKLINRSPEFRNEFDVEIDIRNLGVPESMRELIKDLRDTGWDLCKDLADIIEGK